MAKERKLNPVDAARKKEKAKELKRNKELRKQHREQTMKQMTPDEIREEINKINRLGQCTLHHTYTIHLIIALNG